MSRRVAVSFAGSVGSCFSSDQRLGGQVDCPFRNGGTHCLWPSSLTYDFLDPSTEFQLSSTYVFAGPPETGVSSMTSLV